MPRPELLGFLDAIKRQPEDNTHRLVLADWLDDQGGDADVARAELIRIQCRKEKLREYDPEFWPLTRRERELIRKYGAEWKGCLRRCRGAISYERGLTCLSPGAGLDKFLRCRLAEVCESEAAVWLTELGVWELTDWLLASLAECPVIGLISTLNISGSYQSVLRGEGMAALSACERAPYLSDLRVRYAHSPQMLTGLLSGPLVKQLRRLELGNCGLASAGARVMAECPHLENVADLDLWCNSLRPDAVRDLVNSPHLRKVKRLSLAHNLLRSEGSAALASSPLFGGLETLELWMCRIGNAGLKAFVKAPVLPALRHLDLSGNALTAQAVEALVESPIVDRLECLGLMGARLGKRGAQALASSPRLKNLTRLHLEGCEINDEGACALAESPYLENLRGLKIGGNAVGREGKRALRARFGSRVRDLALQWM